MSVDTKLRHELEQMDEKFNGDGMVQMLGMSTLNWMNVDSSRQLMFNSHIKQLLTLINPDVPRIQTGFENTIGSYSNAYMKLDGIWEVKDIIKKFPELPNSHIYTVVFYNKKKDLYEMIEAPIAESLTEKFGYSYNISRMDQMQVGDKIKDEIIYKSTSFDDQMNYRMGKNATVFYSTSTDTLEDALVVRKGWADSIRSVEIDNVQVSINTNEVPVNLYHDDKHDYKAFPDIGEEVNNSLLCAIRMINNEHLLYDFQKSMMMTTMDTDAEYYVSKHAEVYDIDVYYNGDKDFPDNKFYQQLKYYYDAGNEYAKKLYNWANDIKKSGSNYTDNIAHIRSRYMHWSDKDYKWKNKDRAFANMIVEFKVRALVPLEYGSKITGRFGNKGVVAGIVNTDKIDLERTLGEMLASNTDLSPDEIAKYTSNIQIVDDARMPYADDRPIDLLLNSSGAIRRLNPGQLCEVETNFIGEELRKKICATESMKEKEDMIFKFLDIISSDEASFFRKMYDSYDSEVLVNRYKFNFMAEESKKAFIEDIEKNGFYIVRPPHKPILYKDVMALYEAFPFIKPIPLYIDLFGIKHRKVIKEGVCGTQYVIVLKQNSNKNFSARSTFRVNRSNLPAKDVTKKTNRSSYARTPVRLSEIYNLFSSISGKTLAEYNIFMRSSPIGSKSLDRILSADGNPLKIKKLKVRDNYTNSNADILNARLKAIGLAIEFTTLEDEEKKYNPDTVVPMEFNGYTIYDKWSKHKMYEDIFRIFNELNRSIMMVESYRGEKIDRIWKHILSSKELKDKYPDDFDEDAVQAIKNATEHTMDSFVKVVEEKTKELNKSSDKESEVVKTPARRGRKPKKKYEDLVNEVLEENRRMTEEDSEDYEDSPQNDELIVDES